MLDLLLHTAGLLPCDPLLQSMILTTVDPVEFGDSTRSRSRCPAYLAFPRRRIREFVSEIRRTERALDPSWSSAATVHHSFQI